MVSYDFTSMSVFSLYLFRIIIFLMSSLSLGVVLKWVEPLDSAKPSKKWRLYVFKNDDISETLHLHRQSAYLFGRDKRVADVELKHESCSKQHAVIQYR